MIQPPPPAILSASLMWRGKWFIAGSMLVAIGAAIGYLKQAKPVYEAEARLLVRQKGLQFEREQGFLKDRQFLATEAEILRSEPILRRALQTASPRLPDGYHKDPLTLVIDSLKVTPSPVADVLTISYRSNWEEDSINVIREAIESYQEMLHEAESSVYESTVGVLANREQQLREEIAVLQKQYEEIRRSSPLVGQGREALNLHIQQLTTMGDRLSAARSRKFDVQKKLESFAAFKDQLPRSTAETSFALLQQLDAGDVKHADFVEDKTEQPSDMHEVVALSYTGFGDAALQNSAAAQMFRQQAESKLAHMYDAERQYWQAKSTEIKSPLRSTHPAHAQLIKDAKHWEQLASEQQESWTQFLDEQVEALLSVLDQELKTATKTEQELEDLYAETNDRIKTLDSYLVREQIVQGNIERLEKVHETMLGRLVDFELADQAMARGRASVDVRILERPELTCRLVWPRPPFVLAGSLLLGCLVPVAILATFCRPDQAESQT